MSTTRSEHVRSGADESGAVAVEFALLLPLLLLIVVGMLRFGLAYNTQISLSQAARDGVRGAALSIPGWDKCAAVRNSLESNLASKVTCSGGGVAGTITVGLSYIHADGSSAPACSAGSAPGDSAVVTATYQSFDVFPGISGLARMAMRNQSAASFAAVNITGKGVMRCGG